MPDHTATIAPSGSKTPERQRLLTLAWGDLKIAHRFRAMNTNVEIFAMQSRFTRDMAAAEVLVREVEARFSRFIASSELSQLNARKTEEFGASPEMIALLRMAIAMHRTTRGVFEPAILPQLEHAGYDRSFEQVTADANDIACADLRSGHRSIDQITIEGLVVRLPAGLQIDLGGIGKGYAVDRVAELLSSVGDVLINAGGDMYGAGNGPGGDGWLASVIDTAQPNRVFSIVRLHDEALATSTTAVRMWRRGGRTLHHIIDPRTGQPSASNVVSVSVIAPSAVQADVHAKAALILGVSEGIEFLRAQKTPGFFVLADGSHACSADWLGRPPGK